MTPRIITQQTLPHSAGVKSKCKKPATGKDMAGAPIFAVKLLVAVSNEEEAVIATAAVFWGMFSNKGVSAVGMVDVVGFRNGIFLAGHLVLDPRPIPNPDHSKRD
jgi:hypothetical protein